MTYQLSGPYKPQPTHHSPEALKPSTQEPDPTTDEPNPGQIIKPFPGCLGLGRSSFSGVVSPALAARYPARKDHDQADQDKPEEPNPRPNRRERLRTEQPPSGTAAREHTPTRGTALRTAGRYPSEGRKPRGGSARQRNPRAGSARVRNPRAGSARGRNPRAGSARGRNPRAGSARGREPPRTGGFRGVVPPGGMARSPRERAKLATTRAPATSGGGGNRTRVLRHRVRASPGAACSVFLGPGDLAGESPPGLSYCWVSLSAP